MVTDNVSLLSFSVFSQKGIYALLLGSGISRAAGISTGWEITLDLVRRYAIACKTPTDDPESWYRAEFRKDPDYAEVLSKLSTTQAERQRLLSEYFEPTELELEINPVAKKPTAAHRAIAKLVAKGYVKIIITTNFDRLLEQALADESVSPHIVVGNDGIDGMLPLVHAEPTLLKLHGDYKSTRLRNTPNELANYEPELKILLTEVLNSFGLIVCGWSAEYDQALASAINSISSWRFGTYWSAHGSLKDKAHLLVQHRKGVLIKGLTADELFTELFERIEALESLTYESPLEPSIAMARVKAYLQDGSRKISVHDLLAKESERVASFCEDETITIDFTKLTDDKKIELLNRLSSLSQALIFMCTCVAYWAPSEVSAPCLQNVLERLLYVESFESPPNTHVSRYCAFLIFYAAGIACVLRNNYQLLTELFSLVRMVADSDEDKMIFELLNPSAILPKSLFCQIDQFKDVETPISEIASNHLLSAFAACKVLSISYMRAFEDFELILSVRVVSWKQQVGRYESELDIPKGLFWNQQGLRTIGRILAYPTVDFWEPCKAGVFGPNNMRNALSTIMNSMRPYT